jgi:alpha/beta hydrolase family protein
VPVFSRRRILMGKNIFPTLSRVASIASRCFGAMALAFFAAVARAVVPIPTVIGPIPGDTPGSPGHNYPFFSTDIVLSDYGYVEEEFFFQGGANVYNAPAPSGG